MGGGEEVTGPVVVVVEADIRFDLGLFGSWVGFVCNCWRAFVFPFLGKNWWHA